MTEIDKRSALITFLHQAKRAKWEMLEEYKAKGQLGAQRPDFLWHYLLASFSTWGNSRGYAGLINNPSNYQKVSWSNIENLQDEDLLQVIHETLASAKVSRAKNKAPMLQINARKIKDLGGVEKASDMARSQRGRDAKIAFLRQFKGIGKKYARNIWMDVYDPDFRQSIAIDDRILGISKLLGVSYKPSEYEAHEQFYLDLAQEVGVEGWELDRLLYESKDEIVEVLK